MLGFPEVTQAFYISCPSCADHHAQDLTAKLFCENKVKEYDAEYERFVESRMGKAGIDAEDHKAMLASSRAESLTDATTLDDSGLSTPQVESTDGFMVSTSRKRKLTLSRPALTSSKRSNRQTI